MEAAKNPETFVPVYHFDFPHESGNKLLQEVGSYTDLHGVILHTDSNRCLQSGNFVTLENETVTKR
jgi:hypothetical protein